jgi:hypothetical protein
MSILKALQKKKSEQENSPGSRAGAPVATVGKASRPPNLPPEKHANEDIKI